MKQPTFLDRPARELRQFVRITPSQPIPLRLPDGVVREDIVYDISPTGMQLRCDKTTAAVIHPLDKPLLTDNLPRVEVELTLPLAEKVELISVQCRLCYVREFLGGRISMGMRFQRLDEEVSEYLQKFIEESSGSIS